jgi:hypothetical protein
MVGMSVLAAFEPMKHSHLCAACKNSLLEVQISRRRTTMDELTKTVIERGDLAHLALFLWASGASALLVWSLREMAKVNQHFNDFVQEIASLNRLFRKDD